MKKIMENYGRKYDQLWNIIEILIIDDRKWEIENLFGKKAKDIEYELFLKEKF